MKTYLLITTPVGAFVSMIKEDATQESIDNIKSMIENPNLHSLWLPTSTGFAYFSKEMLSHSIVELKIND